MAVSQNIFPCLHYRDAPAMIDWLGRAFGFAERMRAVGPGGRIEHAELTLGEGVIMVSSAKPDRGWVSPLDLPAVNQQLSIQFTANLFAHLLRLPLAFFEKRHVGDITSRFGSLAAIRGVLTQSSVSAALDGVMAIVTLAMMRPLPGSKVSNIFSLAAGTHTPPMSSLCCFVRKAKALGPMRG